MSGAESFLKQEIETVEQFTVKACEAAERGDWDTVEEYIGRRQPLLRTVPIQETWRRRWLAMNARIEALAEDAKSAIEVALQEAGRTRRSLERLQQSHAQARDMRSRFMDMKA